eukprot:Nk52_evm6s1401 gene=Nk52_evmTU6s1401
MTKPKNLLMIPGPIEVHEDVLSNLGMPTRSHVDPVLIEAFGECIEKLRKVFLAENGQPFIIAGSGTLGWDMTACNLLESGDEVLMLNTGFFGDRFGECIKRYGANIEPLHASEVGNVPDVAKVTEALKAKKYKMVTITHVDTSTGVLMDLKELCAAIKSASPDTLIVIDAVCSAGGELIAFDSWGIDVVITGSQKALGVPPGLCLLCVSQRALKIRKERTATVTNWYGDFENWLPIHASYEARKPSYFATPATNHVFALNTALDYIIGRGGVEKYAEYHTKVSDAFKSAVKALGLKLVAVSHPHSAHTMTTIYYPEGVEGPSLLGAMAKNGITVAGGLHPKIKTMYFRVGHMGISACELNRGHLKQVLKALETSLTECKYEKFEAGVSIATFEKETAGL